MLEEIEEFLCSTDTGEQAEEIADMLEVVKGIVIRTNHSWAKIERITEEKSRKKGGFKDGRVLIETVLPHRDSPNDRQEQVRATDLGGMGISKKVVEISASSLVATAKDPRVIFSYEEDSTRYRVSIKMVLFK